MPLTTENLIVIIGVVIIIFIVGQAMFKLIAMKRKYRKTQNSSKLSGIEVARQILDDNDLKTIYVLENIGAYDNYYDINKKIIRLESTSFNGDSLLDIGISIHQVGYALLDKENDIYLKIRNFLVPIVNIISYIGYFAAMLFILGANWGDLKLTVMILGFVVFFHLITLPLEYKASKRVKKELIKADILDKKEIEDMDIILDSINYTYLGSLIGNLVNLEKSLVNYNKDGNKRS